MRSIHQLCFALQLGIPSTVSTLNATTQLTSQRWRYCFIRPGLILYCQWSNCQQVVGRNVSLYLIHGIQLNSSQYETDLVPIIEISFYIRPFCLSQCPLWVCSNVNRKEILSDFFSYFPSSFTLHCIHRSPLTSWRFLASHSQNSSQIRFSSSFIGRQPSLLLWPGLTFLAGCSL